MQQNTKQFLSLVSSEDYKGSIKLPHNVKYVVVGAKGLQQFPDNFNIFQEYPVLNYKNFALDFSECENLIDFPSGIFSSDETLVYNEGSSTEKTISYKPMVETLVYADLSGCNKLAEIKDCTFCSCNNLETITFPKNIRRIGKSAFEASKLRKIDLSSTNVEIIDDFAFQNSCALQDVVFPECLSKIGAQAFYKCSSLYDICLPKNIKSIHSTAFMDTSIPQVCVPPDFEMFALHNLPFERVRPEECINCGIEFLESGYIRSAIKCFNMALDNNYNQAYYWNGIAYYQLRDYKSVIKNFPKGARFKQFETVDFMILGDSYCLLGIHDKAVENYVKMFNLNPDSNPELLVSPKKEPNWIIDYNTAIIKLHRNHANAYFSRAIGYSCAGMYDLAVADFVQAVRIDSSYFEKCVEKRETFIEDKKYILAYKLLNSLRKNFPNKYHEYFRYDSFTTNQDIAGLAFEKFSKLPKPNFHINFVPNKIHHKNLGDRLKLANLQKRNIEAKTTKKRESVECFDFTSLQNFKRNDIAKVSKNKNKNSKHIKSSRKK